jgi:ribosomal peptide maturation radical SAM protein 1
MALKPVALISMPQLSARYPSFQLALLKPTLEKAGIPAQAFSLFLYFGSRIGLIMGGASLEDDIAAELMRGCPQIDYMHCGDGDLTFPEMVHRLYRGESMRGLRGIMHRENGEVQFAGRSPNFAQMDETPTPDFTEYFYARREGGYDDYDPARDVLLPIEAARGCWWGEKNHCTFCGLNRSGMEFRAKSPERVIEQLESLSRTYGIFHFNAIDNIMAPEYTEKLFGRLAASRSDIQLHYEIRPNFSRTQLGRMHRGGLFSVQPGVESLSTHILKIMRKLTTGMRNVELIKWCTYYGINNLYNILVQFPGETAEDYRLQSDVVAKIPHLQPPYAIVKARADRGSPMYFDPASQSIVELTPSDCYRFIFPEGEFDLSKVSYYFDHTMTGAVPEEVYDELFERVAEWQERWPHRATRPYLRYRKACSSIRIDDGRWSTHREWLYRDDAAALYEFCADARTLRDLQKRFGDGSWVGSALEDFVAKDLMLYLDGRYLSLALPENPNFELEDAPPTVLAALDHTGQAGVEPQLVKIT